MYMYRVTVFIISLSYCVSFIISCCIIIVSCPCLLMCCVVHACVCVHIHACVYSFMNCGVCILVMILPVMHFMLSV